jgi:hypothetical protein
MYWETYRLDPVMPLITVQIHVARLPVRSDTARKRKVVGVLLQTVVTLALTLHANFAGAFPAGLQVGCNFTITLTSAQAVTDFLPQGGPPSALTQNYVDPGSGNISVLAGQVTALALSVGFDAFDPNFGVSAFPLADLELASGTFAGWTVAEVLAEGEAILGGCASQYTASQINDALSTINQNFVDGTTDNGDLVCP